MEKSTGHTLEIVGNATGKGLVDLVDGKAEVAMVSEPLDIAVAAAKAAGKKIDPKTLQFNVVRNDEIVFVVHPANPVTKLTLEQLGDIHIGKITNWKQVGGKDMPITVYSDAVTGGTRAMVKKLVMGGDGVRGEREVPHLGLASGRGGGEGRERHRRRRQGIHRRRPDEARPDQQDRAAPRLRDARRALRRRSSR